jgi:hypothetical protein
VSCTLSWATQFTSTLLLSDLGLDNVRSANITTPFPLGFDDTFSQHTFLDNIVNYAGAPPVSYPTFGESRSSDTKKGIADYTGMFWTAFLPTGSQSIRQSLRNFTGHVTVLQSSSLCIGPGIKDISATKLPAEEGSLLHLNVTIDAADLQRNFHESDNNFFALNFTSSIHDRTLLDFSFSCVVSANFLVVSDPSLPVTTYLCSLPGSLQAYALVKLVDFGKTTEQVNALHDWYVVNETSELDISRQDTWTTLNYRHNISGAWWISLCSTDLLPLYQYVNI